MTVEYCPVSMGVDLLGEKWTLLIVREIITGSHQFNDIHRGLPGLSRTLLSTRLRHLERAEIVAKRDRRYELTQSGEELLDVILAFGAWTVRWRFPRPQPDQNDPYLLLWRIRAGLDHSQIPADRRITLHFALTNPNTHAWITIDGDTSSVCFQDPHYAIDIELTGDTNTWYEIWYGHQTLATARRSGHVTVNGPQNLTEAFPNWLTLSPFARSVAARHRYDSAASLSGSTA